MTSTWFESKFTYGERVTHKEDPRTVLTVYGLEGPEVGYPEWGTWVKTRREPSLFGSGTLSHDARPEDFVRSTVFTRFRYGKLKWFLLAVIIWAIIANWA